MSVIAVGGCESLKCKEIGGDWSRVTGWGVRDLHGNSLPAKLELDPLTSSCRQARPRELSNGDPRFCMAGRQELLWAQLLPWF